MTCNACGEKPKDTAKDFTKAVIEINNPETLVLLRKVVIPASMGTEEEVPASIGKYHNVILHYEANKHTYLYSSDGIPTLLEMEVPQEVWDSIDELQEEIDEIKNSPDVVDIVDTYADLESYDTSELSDKDVIRVLNDETHDGESTYYRWDLSSQTWTFIGGLGPYYTKDETDALIESAKKTWVGEETTSSSSGATAEITTTTGDFEWAEGHTVVVNFKYKAGRSALDIDSTGAYNIDNVRSLAGGIDSGVAIQYVCVYVGGQRGYRPIGRLRASSDVAGPVFIANNLTSGNVGLTALSAYQGKVLKDMIDNNVGKAKVLTADDYNWNSTSSSATEPYDSIALWLLPSGQYQINGNSTKVFTSIAATKLAYPNQHMYLINTEPGANASILVTPYSAATPQTRTTFYVTYVGNGQPSGGTTANGMTIPWGGDIPTVVQNIGNSTTSVMSQKAVRDLIFTPSSNPDEKNNIRIGYQASSYNNSVAIGNQANWGRINSNVVAIGNNAYGPSNGEGSIAIGRNANASESYSICIGNNAYVAKKGCIMLGAWSNGNVADGTMYIGTSNTTYGYNNSGYRLLTGLYDPQNAHDAATKGYVDASVSAIGAGTRKATSAGWNTSAPLNYILQQASSPTQAQGAMFYTGKTLSDFPIYAGIGIYSADTEAEPLPYLLTQITSDDGLGTTTGNPAAYRLALHSEVPSTFTTNEWNALWA